MTRRILLPIDPSPEAKALGGWKWGWLGGTGRVKLSLMVLTHGPAWIYERQVMH